MKNSWAKNAPKFLIRAYEERRIGVGRDILGRLLGKNTEGSASPWTELSRHVRTDGQWLRVWSAIAFAKSKSNKATRLPHKTRSDERDEYLKLAREFASLANKVAEGPLDVLAYELMGREHWAALHVADLSRMTAIQRSDAAFKILPHWPSAIDLLRGLENRASMLAGDAMKRPRPDERRSGDTAGRVFVYHLAKDFQVIFGKKMLGTLAKIANVVFNRVGTSQEFDKSFVQNALRRV